MLEKNILLKKIEEAIASDKTTKENKELLKEIKIRLENGQGFKSYMSIAVELIKSLGVEFVKALISSG